MPEVFKTDVRVAYDDHVGYGSLFEKGFAEDTRYLPVNRGLFLMASYLRRF